MPKFKHYTAALVERQIKAIIRRNPNNVNPKEGSTCVYHRGRGRNIRRCIIGQWGYEQGFRTPRQINGDAEEVVNEHWWVQADIDQAAASLMVKFQGLADGWDKETDTTVPIQWKELLTLS